MYIFIYVYRYIYIYIKTLDSIKSTLIQCLFRIKVLGIEVESTKEILIFSFFYEEEITTYVFHTSPIIYYYVNLKRARI